MLIDHIGIAVADLKESVRLYQALGLQVAGTQEVPEEGVRVAFLPAGESRIELLEPLGEESPVARFLKRRGPGIHHLCIRVADIDAAMDRLQKAGFELLSDQPRAGAEGARVCFVHPRSAGGVLLELAEYGEG